MTDGTKRTLRTAYAAVVGFLTALPVVLVDLPVGAVDPNTTAQLATFAAWLVVVNKAITKLEDRGVIPAWLRDTNTSKEN